jgi:dihydroorotate dehydrogenase electron transfer subunit
MVARPERSRVVSNRSVGPGWYLLRLHEPQIAGVVQPGQFVQIRCAEEGSVDPLLRRPFSVYSVDRLAGTYDVLYVSVGRGTRWMAAIPEAPAEEVHVDVEGPFGNTFSPVQPGKSVYLVAGGVGVAPLYFWALELLAAGSDPAPAITLCMGARSREQLQGIDEFRALPLRAETATDDGSEGYHGRVTELLETLLQTEPDPGAVQIYGCGPQGMNESLRKLCVAREIPCEICLESVMACAFGICFGCVLPIRKDLGGEFYHRRVCWEGPVFDARLLYPGIDAAG